MFQKCVKLGIWKKLCPMPATPIKIIHTVLSYDDVDFGHQFSIQVWLAATILTGWHNGTCWRSILPPLTIASITCTRQHMFYCNLYGSPYPIAHIAQPISKRKSKCKLFKTWLLNVYFIKINSHITPIVFKRCNSYQSITVEDGNEQFWKICHCRLRWKLKQHIYFSGFSFNSFSR